MKRTATLLAVFGLLHGCSNPGGETGTTDSSAAAPIDWDELPLVLALSPKEAGAAQQVLSLTLYGQEFALQSPALGADGQFTTRNFGPLRVTMPDAANASVDLWVSGTQRRELLKHRDQLIEAAPKQACNSLGSIFLKVNSSYSGLKYLEEALKILGYKPGTVDGVWDASAARALQRFQTSHQLPLTTTMDAASEAAIRGQFLVFEEEPGTHVYVSHTGQLKSASAAGIELEMGPNGVETFPVAVHARFLGADWKDYPGATLTGHCLTVSTHPKTRQVFEVSFWPGVYFADRQ